MPGRAPSEEIVLAWRAAVEVTAASYDVDPEAIRAESPGRGYRPPERVREPKKVAIFVAVALADCSYVDLARHVKLHKDTIGSHCDDVRQRAAADRMLEERLEALIAIGQARLELGRSIGAGRDDADVRTLLVALHARFDRIERFIKTLKLHPISSDEAALHPSETAPHENVIELDKAG